MRLTVPVLIAGALVISCAGSYRQSRPDLPPAQREAEELSALYDDFLAALEEGEFDTAEAMLDELERGVKEAGGATIMHRKYGRISEGATRGRQKLKRARRRAKLGSVVSDTEGTLDRADDLLDALFDEGPTEARLAKAEELVEALRGLGERGEELARDPQVAELRPRIPQTIEALEGAQVQFGWLLRVQNQLAGELVLPADPPDRDLLVRISSAEQGVKALRACVRILAAAAEAPDAAPPLRVALPFGRFPLPVARKVCAAELRAWEQRRAQLEWRRDLEEIAGWVTDALVDLESREEAVEILGSTERAVQTLTLCEERLAETEANPGYVAGMVFESHLGERTAPSLREACAKVRGRLAERVGTLRWRSEQESLLAFIADVRQRAKALPEKPSGEEALAELDAVLEGFGACQERAGRLAEMSDPEWAGAKPSRGEVRGMSSLAEMCGKEHAFFAKRRP